MGASKVTKTPSKAATKVKTPAKRNGVPNKSILTFFQKVDRPDDPMFLTGGQPASIANIEDEDIYGNDDEPKLEERFNESQGSVKRRKLSDAEDKENDILSSSFKHPIEKSPPPTTTKPAPPKKRRGGFLDDSDSESDDGSPNITPLQDMKDTSSKDDKIWPTALKPAVVEKVSPSGPIIPKLKHEESTNGDFGEFGDLEDFNDEAFEGEEFREMRFMKEQARLEAEEAGNYSCDDGFETLMDDDNMAPSCPICGGSLDGVSSDQATVHVNSCLDGNPTPLPKSSKPLPTAESPTPVEHETVSGSEVGKRFARAAVARPGQANPISIGGSGPTKNESGSAFSKLMSGHAEDNAWATAAAAEHAARGKPAYQRTCPFYKIMPGFFICVDAFRYGAVEGCRAYFLSHFHSDHYVGLTSHWSHGPIYCSKVTGSLVKSQLKVAEQYVIELEFEKKVPVPGTEGVTVTMIPANHCPGSSLFLFEKLTGNQNPNANSKEKRMQRILHCGDFRACLAHVEHPQLKAETMDALGKVKQQKIDVCYLDTTYLNPRYSFPPQDDVINSSAQLCSDLDKSLRTDDESEWNRVLRRREGGGAAGNDTVSRFFAATDRANEKDGNGKPEIPPNALSILGQPNPKNRNRLLVVCGTYSIGKERICKAIALALKTKIFASAAKIRICQQLGDPELSALMTSNPTEAQVHMQMLMEIRAETLAEYLESYRPHFGRIVGFRPSGWNYRPTMANNGGNGGGKGVAAAAVNANMPPSSMPTTQLLHGPAWRTRFGVKDLIPQRGSTKDAMCFGVPYSEHSSFRELALFVMSLRIEKVVPTVNVGSEPSRRRMKGWTDRWLSERRKGGVTRVLIGSEEEDAAEDKKQPSLWDGKDGRGGAVYW